MTAGFFIKFAPIIIAAAVFSLHLLGYLAELYYLNAATKEIWLAVAAIDMVFAYKCGQLIQSLYRDTYQDSLTGLNNRGFFYSVIKDLTGIKKRKTPISIMMVDIDNFKEINDSYGHMIGDMVLKQVAVIFKNCIREQDVIVRWGGEEFVVLLKDTSLEAAQSIAERVRVSVEKFDFTVNAKSGRITISIGLASIPEPASLDNVIQMADIALYKAKQQGRNKVVVSSDTIRSEKTPC